jgi:hypothetical protein
MECSYSSLPLLFSLRGCLQTRAALRAENLALRHQLLLLQRVHQNRHLRLRSCDRLVWVWLSGVWSNWRSALRIVKPETVIAWHRQGFRLYWKWKSRVRPGRPSVPTQVQNLIQKMSSANPRWGAPRIHGELQKLGIQLAKATTGTRTCPDRLPSGDPYPAMISSPGLPVVHREPVMDQHDILSHKTGSLTDVLEALPQAEQSAGRSRAVRTLR